MPAPPDPEGVPLRPAGRPLSRASLVLSGGGARGAYEGGVLAWILEDLAARGRVPSLHAVSGTSVGAIHAAFLASRLHDPGRAASELVDLWSRLELDLVLRLRVPQALGLWRVLLGGASGAGLFDARALATLVGRGVHWPAIRRHLAEGRLRALTVSATRVADGRPVVFVQPGPGVCLREGTGGRVHAVNGPISTAHVLASAAIPVMFPPVSIGGELFCEGGLRLNTPMGPALRLGAERLLVVSLQTPVKPGDAPELTPGRYPGAPFLAGKILDAFLLDNVSQDLENLQRVNHLLADVRTVAGEEALQRLAALARSRGEPVRREIEALVLRPSVDLGDLAGEHLRRLSLTGSGAVVHALLRLVDVGEGSGSDLVSYLLFDRSYTRALVDLGRADAARQADALRHFLEPRERDRCGDGG